MIRLNFFSIGPVLINGLPPIGEFPCHRQCTQWTRVFLSDSCNHSQSIYHRLLVKRTIFHLFFKNRNNFKFFRSFRKRWTLQKVAIKEFDRSFPVGKFTFHRFLMIKFVPGSTAFDLSLWTIFSDAGFSAEKKRFVEINAPHWCSQHHVTVPQVPPGGLDALRLVERTPRDRSCHLRDGRFGGHVTCWNKCYRHVSCRWRVIEIELISSGPESSDRRIFAYE